LTTIFSRCQTIKFFATKEILEVAKNPEQLKKEKEILSELLKIISGTLAEKFAYTKNIKEEGSDVLLIFKILQKYFREKILTDNSATKKLKLLDELIYKLTFTNASPKLALEILFLEL
jgi:DNA polymerase III gamma/tau subunit